MVGLEYAQPLYSIIMRKIRELGSNNFITWINENFIYKGGGFYSPRDGEDENEYLITDLRDMFEEDSNESS